MKKNMYSDNQSGKSPKGFYAALGISALMIGSACFFAYNQNDKIPESNYNAENPASEAAVDHKSTDIPKATSAAVTSPVVTSTTAVTTTATTSATQPLTLPAAAIATGEPPAAQSTTEASTQAAAAKLENPSSPLADMSNIINPFSGSELVKNETTGSWQTHNGTDIAAEVGTEVFAVSPGKISAVNNDPLWGNTVTIDHHNGFFTKYCGLADDLSVQQGDSVVSGDTIGAVGNSADIESALAPHLHIEITHNGSFVNPMDFIKF